MSATNTLTVALPGSLRDLVGHVVARVQAARAQATHRARLRFELSQYSDRELADMGLSRGDVEDVIASAAVTRRA
jgi:uncharacterized protein YjiS (DUF1127 family)